MVTKKRIGIIIIILIAIFMRFYRLDDLPGELYGDIAIIYDLARGIVNLQFPYFFVLSNGPLYGYIISPIIAVLGVQGFLSYKIASVIVSFFGIAATYFLAGQLSDRKTALVSAFLISTGSWYLVFSRLGNAQIIIPLLTGLSFYCLAYGVKKKKFIIVLLGATIASLGLFEMPQTFVLPVIYLFVAFFYLPFRKILLIALTVGFISIPFFVIVNQQRDLFFSGYIGSKIASQSTMSVAAKIADNIQRTLLMLHVHGDGIFRSNPPGEPQLDFASGIFFLIGIWVIIAKKRKMIPFLIVPFLLLQIPSILVLSEQYATPSASRTIGILPFVAIITAIGMTEIFQYIKNVNLKYYIFFIILGVIFLLNFQRYFVDYENGLPNKNTPIGKIIAAQIDRLPAGTSAAVFGCCWGEWSQPESGGIKDVVKIPRQIEFLQEDPSVCPDTLFRGRKTFSVFSPRVFNLIPRTCMSQGVAQETKGKDGSIIFYSYRNY